MRYFRRGAHRQNGFRPTVAETIFEARRIPISVLFDVISLRWDERTGLARMTVVNA